MYTPHPEGSALINIIPEHYIIGKKQKVEIYAKDLLRLMDICHELTDEYISINPDFVPFFAAGAVPLNIGIMHRLYKKEITDFFLEKKVFHLFPGLKWNSGKQSHIFINYFRKILDECIPANELKIFFLDTTFSGDSIHKAIKLFIELISRKKEINVRLYVRGIIDVTRCNIQPIEIGKYFSQSVKIKQLPPAFPEAKIKDLLTGSEWNPIENLTINLKYLPITNLFSEDDSKLLGATMIKDDAHVGTVSSPGEVSIKNSRGEKIAYETGKNSLSKMINGYLEEIIPDHRLFFAKIDSMSSSEIKLKDERNSKVFGVVRSGFCDIETDVKAFLERGTLMAWDEICYVGKYSKDPQILGLLIRSAKKIDDDEAYQWCREYLMRLKDNGVITENDYKKYQI